MNFNNDNSTQLNIGSATFTPSYSSKTAPNLLLNDSSSGIYNPSINTIKFFTNNIDAFTIDGNQCLYGNATGLTNLGYSNIINKPSTFPSDWNTTINKPSTFSSDWNTTINKPTTFNPDLTNVYTKTEVNNITTLTNYYNKTTLDTTLAGKEAVLTFSSPLTRSLNTVSIDLSSYLTSATASTTYATITNLNAKENTLTFSAPLTRTINTISIDLSSYLTSATASSTYATITNLNAKENTLTFSAPLNRTINNISVDLTGYATTTSLSSYLPLSGGTLTGQLTGTIINANTSLRVANNLINDFCFNNLGFNHADINDFNLPSGFGCRFIFGNTNGPSVNYGSQTASYTLFMGLGINYPASGVGSYGCQLALQRSVTNPTLSVRYKENNAWSSWSAITAGVLNGTANFTIGVWHKSSDNQQRLYFDNNGTTFIQGQNTFPIVFRNNANADIGSVSSTGIINANLKLQEAGVDISTKYFLKTGDTISGKLQILTAGTGVPTLAATGGTGDYIILKQGSGTVHPYSFGLNTSEIWYSVPSGNNHNFYINGSSVFSISSGGIVSTGTIGGTTINEGGVAISTKYLSLGGGTLTGALTGTTINASSFVEGGTALISKYLSLGGGTLTGALTGTTINAASFVEGGTALSSKYLSSASLNNYILKAGDTMTGNLNINSSTQLAAKILITGQEFYQPSNSMSSGIAFLLGVNRTGNKQLWIADSTDLTQNTSIQVLRLNTTGIDCIATNGTTAKPINIGNTAGVFLGGNTCIGTGTAKSTTTQLTISGSSSSYSNPLVQITQNAAWDGNYALQVKGYTNIGGDGSATGLRINGEDTGNTIYQNGNRDMGLTVNNANMYFNTNGANRMYISGSTGHVNINNNSKLIFNNNIDDMRIQLWEGYGFGINGGTLRYNTMGNHTFFINGGEIIRFNSVGMGFGNTNPQSYMHLGNVDLAGSSPVLLFGKRLWNSSGFRTAFIGYNDAFYFCIGDAGNVNSSVVTTQSFKIAYTAPDNTLALNGDGKCYSLQFVNTSDEKTKTDIETIEDALWKVQQLRGVSYTNILHGFKAIGLIAQEVENILPESVSINDTTGLKGIDYSGMIGLLINAIKEQQQQINELKNILIKNNLN